MSRPRTTLFRHGPASPECKDNRVVSFVSQLGGGAFGTVWKASYQGKVVAVKVTNCPTGFRSTEVELLRRAQGPHTVEIIAEEATSKGTGIIMKLCEGGTLKSQLERLGPRAEADQGGKLEYLRMISEILEGLMSLHNSGIIYGDLKPDNILLDEGRMVFTGEPCP